MPKQKLWLTFEGQRSIDIRCQKTIYTITGSPSGTVTSFPSAMPDSGRNHFDLKNERWAKVYGIFRRKPVSVYRAVLLLTPGGAA